MTRGPGARTDSGARRARRVAIATPAAIGALLLVAVIAGSAWAVSEDVSGGLGVSLVFGLPITAVGALLLFGAWRTTSTSRASGSLVGSTFVLLGAVVVAANSQWYEPDLDYRTWRCGGEVCSIHFGTAGLPTWNAQRGVGLAVASFGVVSIAAAISLARRRALLAAFVVAAVLATAVGSIGHARRSADHTRSQCARFLALQAGSRLGAHQPPADALDKCRHPERFATDRQGRSSG